jgi:translocation and assembly module TamB
VAVQIDLGDRLKLRGRGIDTGVRGLLHISSPGGRLALNGSVRTEGGTYAAYGQKLEIERGELVFTGTPDNPRLDVLAIRPNLDVRVGVSVVGSAQNPRIRLASEPEMPEFDKLSWLVLGRSPDDLGRADTALLQRAAVALLAGGDGKAPTDALVQALGLTDFSLRQTEGDVRETIVSLGKQLSRRWYVGYERSINTTTGTWQLIYRVAQRVTVRAQSGAETAVDVIWSWRW